MCVRVCVRARIPLVPRYPIRAIEDREQMCVKRARLQGKDTTRDDTKSREMIMIARELLRKTRLSRVGNHHPSHKRVENWFCAVVVVRARSPSFVLVQTSRLSAVYASKIKKRRKRVICFCLASSLCLGFARADVVSTSRFVFLFLCESVRPHSTRSRCFCSS